MLWQVGLVPFFEREISIDVLQVVHPLATSISLAPICPLKSGLVSLTPCELFGEAVTFVQVHKSIWPLLKSGV